MITVYTICFNEEFMLPHFIAHYRSRFPDCKIVVYDNESTDRTVEIALANDCEVRTYKTGGKLDDTTYLQIKNNCWKDAKTDWVLIADCDELCNIYEVQLKQRNRAGVTMIPFHGFNMVNLNDDMNFESIAYGVRAPSYDKAYLFNRKHIKEINYGPGCHSCAPQGYVDYGKQVPQNVYHYKYLNPDYMVNRHKVFASRLSAENLKRGYGGHYLYTEEQIRNEFAEARKQAIKIL